MINDLRNLDFRDVGSAPSGVKIFLLVLAFAAIVFAGYWVLIKDKVTELERVQAQEMELRQDFEAKQQKAANLEPYRQQLADMEELLESMLRQLPSKTEIDKLLVDVSQSALASGIDTELFEPRAEVIQDFYAEQPISIRMRGTYHEFGDFVSSVASLPRVVILTMHDIALERPNRNSESDSGLTLEGTVKTYRYLDDEELAQAQAAAEGGQP